MTTVLPKYLPYGCNLGWYIAVIFLLTGLLWALVKTHSVKYQKQGGAVMGRMYKT